ncbi:unnamed protein product [Cochlearia groenlandica]
MQLPRASHSSQSDARTPAPGHRSPKAPEHRAPKTLGHRAPKTPGHRAPNKSSITNPAKHPPKSKDEPSLSPCSNYTKEKVKSPHEEFKDKSKV